MGFYSGQLKAGHLLSDIDNQDIIAYIEMNVYTSITDYVKKLAEIDSGGGGVSGSL